MQLLPHCDLFETPGDCRVITVNCLGAMGLGIAETFRDRYKKQYWEYKRRCKQGQVWLGVPELIQTDDGLRWLLFPTKHNWRESSQYSWIQWGLQYLIENIGEPDYVQHDWTLVFPPLGCGHGNLDFQHIARLMNMFDGHVPNDIILIAPQEYEICAL